MKYSLLTNILNHPLNKNFKVRTFFRIIFWKLNQLFFKFPLVFQLAPKIKCVCYPNSSFGSLIVFTRLPEYFEMMYLTKILKPNSTFFDVGANIGAFSLIASSKIKVGKIVAFEPSSKVLPNLYENIALNRLDTKVQVVEKIVSDKTGYELFVSEEISEISHIAYDSDKKKHKKQKMAKVPSVALDKFASENRISFVDVVKIDVEGAEMKVLKGFSNYLKSGKVGTLLLEIHMNQKNYGIKPVHILGFLDKLGYRVFLFDKQGNLGPFRKKDYKNLKETVNVVVKRKKLPFRKISRRYSI